MIADFLTAIPHTCVSVCVDISGRYGLQTVDINISLTSIGLLVGVVSYLRGWGVMSQFYGQWTVDINICGTYSLGGGGGGVVTAGY